MLANTSLTRGWRATKSGQTKEPKQAPGAPAASVAVVAIDATKPVRSARLQEDAQASTSVGRSLGRSLARDWSIDAVDDRMKRPRPKSAWGCPLTRPLQRFENL